MRQAALLACLLLGRAAVARAGGAVEIKAASPATLAAVQAVVQSPAGAALSADAPDLGLARTLRADSAADLAALGALSAYLPADFAAQAAAAAAGDARATASAAAALRRAYAQAADVAATVLEARTKRLRRARLSETLTPEEWRRAIDGLAGYALYGGEARRKVEQWRAWQAGRAGQAAVKAAEAAAGALAEPDEGRTASGDGVVSLAAFRGRAPKAGAGRQRVNLRAGTRVKLRLLMPVDSETALAGHAVMYELASDVMQDGVRVLRQGTRVDGVVRSAEPRGILGRPGSLEVAPVEIVTDDGVKVPLVRGGDRVEPAAGKNALAALAVLVLGLAAHFLVLPMPFWAFLALFAAAALLYVFTTGYSARATEELAASTDKDAVVRVDAA